MKKPSLFGRKQLIVTLLFSLTIFIYTLWSGLGYLQTYLRAKDWPLVNATMTSVEWTNDGSCFLKGRSQHFSNFRYYFTFIYEVDEKAYTGREISSPWDCAYRTRLQETEEFLLASPEFAVYVNPKDPEDSVAVLGLSSALYHFIFSAIFLLGSIGIFIILKKQNS